MCPPRSGADPAQGRRRRGRGRVPRARRPAARCSARAKRAVTRPARAAARVDAARGGREVAAPAGRRRRRGPGRPRARFRRLRQAGESGPGAAADAARPDRRPAAPVGAAPRPPRAGCSAPTTKGSRRASPRSASGPSASRRASRAMPSPMQPRTSRPWSAPSPSGHDGRRATRPRLGARPGRARPVERGALDFAAGEWRNGRRAGLRSRCRVSGVEVRPLSRLQASMSAAPDAAADPLAGQPRRVDRPRTDRPGCWSSGGRRPRLSAPSPSRATTTSPTDAPLSRCTKPAASS